MTTPGPQLAYLQSYGQGTIYPTVIIGRAPTTNDFNGPNGQQYQVTQRWINSAENYEEWMLVGYTSSNGVVSANWVNLSAAATFTLTFDGDTGSAVPAADVITISGGSTGLTTAASGALVDLTGTLNVANGGTSATSFNINGAVYSNTTTSGALHSATLTSGQLLIGGTTTPAAANLTAGTGISISNGNNSITISATGTTTLTVTSVNHAASPYTVLTADEFIACQTSTGTITLLLPNAPSSGRVYIIKDSNGSASSNNITVTTVGGAVNIDGATSYVMNVNYQSLNLLFDGTAYEVF